MADEQIVCKTVDEVIEKVCNHHYTMGKLDMHSGRYPNNLTIVLEDDYGRVKLKETSNLKLAFLNDKTMEMVFVAGTGLRVYKYKDKEYYKADVAYIRNQSVTY